MPVQPRRRLLLQVRAVTEVEFIGQAEKLAQRYPRAADLPLADVAEFHTATTFLDQTPPQRLLQVLRQARVATPPPLRFHPYRLGRHLLRRWGEPRVRSVLLGLYQIGGRPGVRAGLQDPTPELLREFWADAGSMLAIHTLTAWNLAHHIPALLEALTPDQACTYRATLQLAQVMMHRYVTEPEPTSFSPAELRTIKRRIRHYDLTLRSGRRSLYALGAERKAILRQIYQIGRQGQSELAKLAAIQCQAEADLAVAEVAHAEAMVTTAARHNAERTDLAAQIQFAHADFSAALAIRNAWMPVTLLQGKTVAVVGDEERAEGYRLLIEGAGGRFTYASAVHRLQRISGAVGAADAVILLTGGAKHAAEAKLRRSLGPGTLYIRCPRTGLGAFERTLRTEVIPRLATRMAAPGRS